MILKKTEQTLCLRVERRREGGMGVLSAGLLLLGLWGMAEEVLSLGVIPFLLAALAFFLSCWDRRWLRAAPAVLFALCLLMLLLFWNQIGAAELWNRLSDNLTRRTGYLFPLYEARGSVLLAGSLLAVLLGTAVGCCVRLRSAIPALLALLCVVIFYCMNWIDAGVWTAIFALGCLLALCRRRSLRGLALATGIAAAVFAVCFLLGAQLPVVRFHFLHEWRYETAENPLPEGKLDDLGAFSPTDEAALTVTMGQWQTVYLRGYVGSVYGADGWESLPEQTLADAADLLYSLQKEHFFAATQLAAANAALGVQTENTIAVESSGACKKTAYLPYGAASVGDLNPHALLTEGNTGAATYETALYDIQNAYLLQEALASTAQLSDYFSAEAAYRTFVYENFLTVPEESAQALAERFDLGGAWTTARACEQISRWLQSAVTYDETAVTGGEDLCTWLLDFGRRGSSVHYATLSTLLLRTMGIPARYVEGYVVADGGELPDGASLTLTQRNARAWTEFYLDGVGWIPFDATPKNALTYVLPEGGTAQPLPPPDDPPQEEPDTPTRIEPDEPTRETASALWLLLLLPLVPVLRTIVLRRRLKRRIARFSTAPCEEAAADCARYILSVWREMGLPDVNCPLTQRTAEIAALTGLPEEKLQAFAALTDELLFSGHLIGETQRRMALELLQATLDAFRAKTPRWKRLVKQYLTCQLP